MNNRLAGTHPFWLCVGNWVAVLCVLPTILSRMLPNCAGKCTPYSYDWGDFATFMPIADQPILLQLLIFFVTSFVVIQSSLGMFAYVNSSMNVDEDVWETEEELAQRIQKQRQKYTAIAARIAVSVAVLCGHYVVGVYIGDRVSFVLYLLFFIMVNYYCIAKMRNKYPLPSLSTYELAKQRMLFTLSAAFVGTSLLSCILLASSLWLHNEKLCSTVLCAGNTLTQTIIANNWQFNPAMLDAGIYLLLICGLLLTVALVFLLRTFRRRIFSLWKTVVILLLLALPVAFVAEILLDNVHLRILLQFVYSICASCMLFFAADIYSVQPNDSVAVRLMKQK